MNFSVSDEVARAYADLKIGVVVVKKIDCGDYPNSLRVLKENREKYIRFNFRSTEQARFVLSEHPHLASWRAVYKSFGFDEECSAEQLIRRTLETGALPKVNKLVDIYNLVSASRVIPIGGQDLDEVRGDVTLRFSSGGEPFVGIGGKAEKTRDGEVVYADEEKILCRKWNKIDCDAAKFTSSTKRAALFVDGIGKISAESVKAALKELEGIITDCGGETNSFFLDGAGVVSF
jgi:DNA/RNA-binding domain of Phe-tRNA-synthetase-like protein